MSTQWYWCLRHSRPEREGEACSQDNRLGPYESEAAARNWKQRHEAREEAWEEQDEEWDDWGETPDASDSADTA